jgi:Fe-S-cluster containining protein
MERNVSLEEISDGRLYELNDLVKADCNDCKGCSACCQGMGNSITLDPLDLYRFTSNLNLTFEELLINKIELKVVEGIIMPNLKMQERSERCSFLSSEGRCDIHSFRPGICRLFPLGRFYENHGYKYFLQIHECKKSKTKIKVRKWIDTPDIKDNEEFVINWHYFLKDLQKIISNAQDEKLIRNMNLYILNQFYRKPYDVSIDFYQQFKERLREAREILELG